MPVDPNMRIEKRFGVGDALIVLAPQARWAMTNDEYESVDWMDEAIPMPSKAEVLAKVAELQAPKPEMESKGHDDEAQDKELIAQMIDDRLSQAFAQFIKMQRSQQQSPQEEALEVSPQTQNPQEEAMEQPGLE